MTLTAAQSAALVRWRIDQLEQVDDHPFAWWAMRGEDYVVVKAGDVEQRRREAVALRAFDGDAPPPSWSTTSTSASWLLSVSFPAMTSVPWRARTTTPRHGRLRRWLRAPLPSGGVADLPHLREISAAFERSADPRIRRA